LPLKSRGAGGFLPRPFFLARNAMSGKSVDWRED